VNQVGTELGRFRVHAVQALRVGSRLLASPHTINDFAFIASISLEIFVVAKQAYNISFLTFNTL